MTVLMTMIISGCEDRNHLGGSSISGTNNPDKSNIVRSAADNRTEKWLGKWVGPEGTYLTLSTNDDKYVVEIHSLDGVATYDGASTGDSIAFQRNGKTESIHAGNGEETGMKWLLEKKNCLIIRTGEGFCRD